MGKGLGKREPGTVAKRTRGYRCTTKMAGFYRKEGQPAFKLKKFRVGGMSCQAGGPVTDRD